MDDFDSLIHVEQTFYESGYEEGYAHGRLHGLIEGRALGREKGFEMWEELGFYEGFAITWKTFLESKRQPQQQQNTGTNTNTSTGKEKEESNLERILTNITRLLELINQFPKVNSSSTETTALPSTNSNSNETLKKQEPEPEPEPELDIQQLFSRIRSRYKILCSSLGVRPSIRASNSATSIKSPNQGYDDEEEEEGDNGNGSGKRRDKKGVWTLSAQSGITNQDLSY